MEEKEEEEKVEEKEEEEEEEEDLDPKEHMKKENAPATDSIFWKYNYKAFQRCQSKEAYKGVYKARKYPSKSKLACSNMFLVASGRSL